MPLFPVFQCAGVCSQIDGEDGTRDLQVLPYANQFLRCNAWSWFLLHRMSSERSLSMPRVGESFHSLAQFSEQITRCVRLRFGID
jgi:hypothetical protein